MTPAAHVQACIELLDRYCTHSKIPADQLAQSFFRERRYMGSRDKKAVAELYYALIREWGILSWLMDFKTPHWPPARGRVLWHFTNKGWTLAELKALFTGEKYAPDFLSAEEGQVLSRVVPREEIPDEIKLGVPLWMKPLLEARFGERTSLAVRALLNEAPLDIRVNPLKVSRDEAFHRLCEREIDLVPTPFSPLGLRIPGRVSREFMDSIGEGALEVQDEASQLVALLADAQPGQQVLDLCAGAGGKSLVMAAQMRNKGQLVAADISERRLESAKRRFRRAGIHNAVCRIIDAEADGWLKRQKNRFHRVFLDVPCSGSGTWRRNPDLLWRMAEDSLGELQAVQAKLLRKGAALVAPGGRLIYTTCSIFRQENQHQIEKFLEDNNDFQLKNLSELWHAFSHQAYPCDSVFQFEVSPLTHNMDGFFTVVLEKK